MWLRDVMAGIGLLVFVGASFAVAAILPALSAYG
jgi:hypothetical protein